MATAATLPVDLTPRFERYLVHSQQRLGDGDGRQRRYRRLAHGLAVAVRAHAATALRPAGHPPAALGRARVRLPPGAAVDGAALRPGGPPQRVPGPRPTRIGWPSGVGADRAPPRSTRPGTARLRGNGERRAGA